MGGSNGIRTRYTAEKPMNGYEYLHFSTEVAAEYGTANRWLAVGVTMDGAKVAYPEFRFAELNANGGDDRTITISFPGTNKTITRRNEVG